MRKIKYWIRRNFGFSQGEVNGFLVLIGAMVLLTEAPLLFKWFTKSEINAIETRSKIKDRIEKIKEFGAKKIDYLSAFNLRKLKKTNKYIGKDTVSAMNNGMYWGYIGLIKELVQKIIKETKKKYLVIFTGGLANIFFSSFPFKDKVIDQQITLKGIAETLKFNLKNI